MRDLEDDLRMKTFILFVLATSSLFARSLTPSELAVLAEDRAPLIRMQIENKASAGHQINQSKLLANPMLIVQSGKLKTGTQNGAVVDVTVNQPIPWPGKRYAEINSAKILEKISDVDLEQSKLLVNHSVALLGIEYAVISELEKHNQERKHRFSIIHRFLTSRPQASPKQMVEKNLIETQINLVESQMFDLETKKMSLREQLTYYSGEVDPEVLVNWDMIPKPGPKDEFVTRIEEGPHYRKSKRMEDLARNRIEQASYFAKPDIQVGVNYRQENVAPTNHFYHANLAVVIPIIDRGQHSEEIARANARKEEANTKLTHLSAMAEINQEYQSLIAAYRSTELFRISKLKRTEDQFHQAEDAFKKGRIDVTTFLQTDMQLHESIDLAFVSFIKYYTALSRLKMLSGQKLEIK